MKVLIDTHIVLLALMDDPKMPKEAENLAQSIRAANNSDSAYDANVKHLLADKQIVLWILKYTLIEFADMEASDIRDCIGDDIEINTKPVDAGLSNLGRVQETITEDNVPGEGITYYDVRFTAYHKGMEFFHSDFDNLKRVRSIWICMDNKESEDSIEEIGLESSMIFGNSENRHHTDLMKGIIINIRNGENTTSEMMKKFQNKLIAMLEELLCV